METINNTQGFTVVGFRPEVQEDLLGSHSSPKASMSREEEQRKEFLRACIPRGIYRINP